MRRRAKQGAAQVPNKRIRLKEPKEEPKDTDEDDDIKVLWWNFWFSENGEIQIKHGDAQKKCIQLLYDTPPWSEIDIRTFFKKCATMVRCVDTSFVITSRKPHYGQVLARSRDINPNLLPEKRTKNFFDYSNKTVEQRKQRWKEGCVVVKEHNDVKLWLEEKQRTIRLYETTPILEEDWTFRYEPEVDMVNRSFQRASKYLELTKEDQSEILEIGQKYDLPEELDKYHDRQVYVAPERRIRIATDIGWTYDENFKYRIPVYSDILGETPENIEIPDTLCFDYINNNVVDKYSEPLFADIVRLAAKEQNHIKCNCEPGSGSCFDNPECPCFRMNKALEKMNTVDNFYTSFCSTEPLKYFGHAPDFYEHAAFACSEICGCKGSCKNNVLTTVQGKVFPMEVYRQDKTIGFGLRSTSIIPPGMPVVEFCGEVMKTGRLLEGLKSYSMQLTDPTNDEGLLKVINEESGFSKSYLKRLNNLYRVTAWHIDCKWQGNCSRFIMNSCTPNLEPIRVFQKSLSPAHVKVVMFSLKSILPGEPLSFDYGPTYDQAGKKPFVCQCGSFACRNGPDAEIFSKMEVNELAACFTELHQSSIDRFESIVHSDLKTNASAGLYDDSLTCNREDQFENTPNYYRIYEREVRGENQLIGFHRFRYELLTELNLMEKVKK